MKILLRHCEPVEGRRGNLLLCRKMMMKQYWVYMMTNRNKTVIYTGVTNDLKRGVQEHKAKKDFRYRKI